ncbi:putative Dna repair helicase [Leptomonas pyrrhocoris]|uniref:Putative Dna repair helicase n=1 Tax=Leptomonas pyrrhocoris TaxID=157538 RepID=A0A0N0DQR1_LEPPY|nr:putative Dna repair helicase [Leptomonas pyrrhocoris]KPA73642.1 putative Dna repair helicase [Leptomonas pyrrhocoris]|eukprot:XP_015652081.1 putative Dna repair helicase [Leptomonas pyrrhocoris]
MRRVGPYEIPFPYAPYPLQEHAMTALREFLEEATTAASTANKPARGTSHHPAATAMAVLESPTGTGKSQMLLNTVLSCLFEPVCPMESKTGAKDKDVAAAPSTAGASADGNAASCTSKTDAESSGASMDKNGSVATASFSAPRTLEEVLRQRQLEEEINQLRRERKARVKAQRRLLRRARKFMRFQSQQQQQQQAGSHKGEAGGEEYLLAQDPVAWYAEQQQQHASAGVSSRSLSSSSSSASSSVSSDLDEASSDAGDAEGALEENLATMIPLRKPKVYVASRTHTQLQQLMEDLQRTAFAQHPLRVRSPTSQSSSSTTPAAARSLLPPPPPPPSDALSLSTSQTHQPSENAEASRDDPSTTVSSPPPLPPTASAEGRSSSHHPGTSSLHRLFAVHVAGRQHLCLNARLQRKAGGLNSGGEMLNHYCREAMQYERSQQGRADRRRRRQQQHQGLSSVDSNGNGASTEKTKRSALGAVYDIEDYASPRGAPYSMKKTHQSVKAANGRGGDAEDEEGEATDDEDKGCVFCAESHLRALMEYITAEQHAQQRADRDAAATPLPTTSDSAASDNSRHHDHPTQSGASPPWTPSASIYTMARLRHLGRELQACPYLATRLLLRGADVAFIPYSYLLDEGQRTALLGGVTTNPATAAEAEAVGLHSPDDVENDVSAPHVVGRVEAERVLDGAGYEAYGGASPRTAEGATTTAASASPTAPAVSLGAVLYHRRQRVTATAAFRQRRKHQQQQQQAEEETHIMRKGCCPPVSTTGATRRAKDDANDDGDVWHVMARSAPPSFRGDVLVFDEAHNIADHCRTTSTVPLSPWHLQLAEGLCSAYLRRYETRLLTRNKQRLRELIRFLGKLTRFCTGAATTTSAVTHQGVTAGASGSLVYPFHTFLFESGIDNVDVYSLLLFLVDSQLLVKLQGFVGYCLEREKSDAKTAAAETGAATARGTLTRVKRSRGSTAERASEVPVDERQRQRRFLASLDADTTAQSGPDPLKSSCPLANRPPCETSSSASSSSSSLTLTTLLHARDLPDGNGGGFAASLDAARQRAVVAEALQRIERLLCMLYVSDTVSTRVLWTPPAITSSAPGGGGESVGAVAHEGGLKLIQLEPGTHTFVPLAREATAVVLAGGTMQPLALTCGPLLPLGHGHILSDNAASIVRMAEHGECDEGAGRRAGSTSVRAPPPIASAAAAVSAVGCCEADGEFPVRLISEGHVVPPTSVRVFTLGTGPSAVRLEFTQQLLGHRSSKASALSATTTVSNSGSSSMRSGGGGGGGGVVGADAADRLFAEVGCSLLNLSRVLPAAGTICFFTSYDMMDRTVDALRRTGYYDEINAVKRIFRETRGGKGSAPNSGGGGGRGGGGGGDAAGVAKMLQQYQNWIYGDDVDAFPTPSPAPSLTTKKTARRGALLLAVMGGRLSEGINFADDLGRAVVVIGMPYANPTDVELQLNLRHIAATRLRCADATTTQTSQTVQSNSTAGATTASPFTSAAEWGLYMDGMMRTVNQCIGRCIRHSGDYAAIILIDARYGEREDVRRRVSAWLQPSLRVCRSFGECFAGVRTFFEERRTAQETVKHL